MKYDFHDIANIYPLANGKEFELLKKSIQDIGQEHPITIYDGKILDGRNRYKACLELRIEPIIKEFIGTEEEALKYANYLNSGRRNMNKSQNAMMAAIYILESREDSSKTKVSVKTASELFLVSEKYIKRAMIIRDKNKTMSENIFSGKLLISQAEHKLVELDSLDTAKNLIELGVSRSEEDEFSVEETEAYNKAIALYDGLPHTQLIQRLYQCEKSKSGY